MRFSILTAVIVACYLSVFQFAVFAQDRAVSEAPVLWERYRVSGRSESVLMPKLPVLNRSNSWSSSCTDVYWDHYFAYAEDAVYEFTLFYKGQLVRSPNCEPVRFSRTVLDNRLKEIRRANPAYSESTDSKNGLKRYTFTNDLTTRWLVSDMANNRWVELAVYHRSGVNTDDSKFSNSLDLNSSEGKDIGEGSEVTLGDAGVDTSVMSPQRRMQDPVDPNTEPYRIISKSMAAYTEQARNNGVQGSVSVKIVFLANGGIGPITVTGDPLKDGLTERVIAAARRIVFLPKKVNGIPVSTTVSFQYHFTLY